MLITLQITRCCFGNSQTIWRNDRAKEGMIVIIIIIIIVTVIWGGGAPESCGFLRFIKTCSPSALVLSHIPQRVKLFVTGCVGAVEGGERDMCVSQQLHSSGIEERAVWYIANRSTTCQSTHTVTTPPCRHITGKPLTITGRCRYNFSKRWSEQFFKYSVVFDLQCQVYDLSAVASGWCSSVDSSPLGWRVTGQEKAGGITYDCPSRLLKTSKAEQSNKRIQEPEGTRVQE